jgi:hypothetical protein
MADTSITQQREQDDSTDVEAVDSPIGKIVREHPVVVFFAIVFAYSWGVFALLYGLVGSEQISEPRVWQIPFAWGPPIAALVVIRVYRGDIRIWLGTVNLFTSHLLPIHLDNSSVLDCFDANVSAMD